MRRFLVLAVTAGLLASACSSSNPTVGPALRVDDIELSRDELHALLEWTAGVEVGTSSTIEAAAQIQQVIELTALGTWLGELGVEITDADRRAAAEQVDSLFVAQPDPPPDGVLDLLTLLQGPVAVADRLILEGLPAPYEPTEDDVRALHDATIDAEAEACVSHILFAIELQPLDEGRVLAAEAVERLDAGEPWSEVVLAMSDDTVNDGGILGCFPRGRWATDLPEFEEAIWTAPVGQPVVVESIAGVQVVSVDARNEPSFEDRAPQLRAELRVQAVLGGIQATLATVDVELDPRYGTWQLATSDPFGNPVPVDDPAEATRGQVFPPEGPVRAPVAVDPFSAPFGLPPG